MHEQARGAPGLVQNPTRGWISPLTLRIRVWHIRCGPSRGIAECEWQHLLLHHVGEECDLGKLDLHSQADRLAEVPLAHAVPQSRPYVRRLRGYPWETRGMMRQVLVLPNFKVVVTLDVIQGGGPADVAST